MSIDFSVQCPDIAARVAERIAELERERDELFQQAMNLDRLAQSFKAVLKGPRGVLTPTRRGQLILMLGCDHIRLHAELYPDQKTCFERGGEMADFLNSAGWRFVDKRGKPRKITKRDVDDGVSSLKL